MRIRCMAALLVAVCCWPVISASAQGGPRHGEAGWDSVDFRTEYEVYPANTRHVVGIWENGGDRQILHGDGWTLERLTDGKWVKVNDIDHCDGWAPPFYTVGYPVAAHTAAKRVYPMDQYTHRLKLGAYRITSGVYRAGLGTETRLAAEFQVIAPVDFKGFDDTDPRRSDWRYEDITPAELLYESSPRIYRHAGTGETLLVDGGERHLLGEDAAGKGVGSILSVESGGRRLLLYTQQRGKGASAYSRVGVYDIDGHKDVFLSRRYSGRELEIWYSDGDESRDISTYEVYVMGNQAGDIANRGPKVGTFAFTQGQITYTPL